MRKLILCSIALLNALTLMACNSSSVLKQPAQALPAPVQTPAVTVTQVQAHELSRRLKLPGELQPWQDTAIYAKVQGFVEAINVDRGSIVRKGQLLVRLRAPELDTQRSEAEARVRAAQSQKLEAETRINSIRAQRLEAQAKLAAEELTYQRLRSASATPGAVAGNELDLAQKAVEAAQARIQIWNENEKTVQAQVKALEENERVLREASLSARNIEAYLKIVAPFDGVITERHVHQGSLATTNGLPLLRLQQVSRLRGVVSVPESEIAGVPSGASISFTLPAFPGETFSGVLQRNARSLDAKTRTLPIELDVNNASGRLAPGMFPEIIWPVRRPRESLFVPPAAIATTTERSFVIRIRDGAAEWVDVRRGASMTHEGNDLIEVFGALAAGDIIAARGTDELRAGTRVNTKPATPPAK
jgi:RND family efflux transporter MFP subunit